MQIIWLKGNRYEKENYIASSSRIVYDMWHLLPIRVQ